MAMPTRFAAKVQNGATRIITILRWVRTYFTSFAMDSVSVSETKTQPLRSSNARSALQLVMMPLCTTVNSAAGVDMCGWQLTSLGGPCWVVRVCVCVCVGGAHLEGNRSAEQYTRIHHGITLFFTQKEWSAAGVAFKAAIVTFCRLCYVSDSPVQ